MQKGVLILLLLCAISAAKAQDTVSISYSEESDTLIKQRFLDRYENVFMTKVPTRHMFKIGLSQYYQSVVFPLKDDKILNNSSLQIGYEFKFLPAFSIALTGHLPYSNLHTERWLPWQNIVLDGQLRWFIDMRRRIRAGKSANNFSGNYIAAFYNLPNRHEMDRRIGLKFGFQRRFLNFGFMDFALALHQDAPFFYYGILENWSLASQLSMGFAFGDWKRARRAPLCDILFCDAQIRSQWKIRLPELTVGYYLNRVKIGVAFEKKLGTWPASINFQLDAAMNNGFNQIKYGNMLWGYYRDYMQVYSREKVLSFAVQPRYYALTKRQQLKGKSTNGMSGLYAGINTQYYYYKGKHSDIPPDDLRREDNIINVGPMAGFQLRLFNHGYFDCNTSYNFQDYLKSTETNFDFRTNITLGLAF
ncbi:hypothetical protein SAMN04487996_11166 [Dyadobacter soli]|uniref:Outer membrane protein beta-barrel domain-containing protein n=1 Tax=Dyadobacter soli TaxID=659014 RepID=A0A1G7LSI5_9BACT|nr:hypothetical protein [Dyadobacter soli]SDF52314.1 hypothetical protein SAMN04487996_11166 [Dyadobacter soli]